MKDNDSKFIYWFKGASIEILFFGLSIFLTLFIPPYVLKHIDSESYGSWLLVLKSIALLGVFDFGLNLFIPTITSSLRQNTNESISYQKTFIQITFFSFILILLFSSILYSFNATSLPFYKNKIFFLMAIVTGIGFFSYIPVGVLAGKNKILTSIILNNSITFLIPLLVLILLSLNFKIWSFPISYLVINCLITFLGFYLIRDNFTLNDLFTIDKDKLRSALDFSKALYIGKIGSLLILNTDQLFISKYLGNSTIVLFSINMALAGILRSIPSKLASPAIVEISRLFTDKNYIKLRAIYYKINRLSLRVGLLASCCLILINKSFISFWVGEKYYLGLTFSIVLSLIIFRDFFVNACANFFIATGNQSEIKKSTYLSLTEGLLNIIITYILVIKFGVIGIIVGTLVSGLINAVYVPFRINTILNVHFFEWFKNVFIHVLIKNTTTILITIIFIYSSQVISSKFLFLIFLPLLMIINLISNDMKTLINYRKISMRKFLMSIYDNA